MADYLAGWLRRSYPKTAAAPFPVVPPGAYDTRFGRMLVREGAGLGDVSREAATLWALAAVYFPTACVAEWLRQRKVQRLRPAA